MSIVNMFYLSNSDINIIYKLIFLVYFTSSGLNLTAILIFSSSLRSIAYNEFTIDLNLDIKSQHGSPKSNIILLTII